MFSQKIFVPLLFKILLVKKLGMHSVHILKTESSLYCKKKLTNINVLFKMKVVSKLRKMFLLIKYQLALQQTNITSNNKTNQNRKSKTNTEKCS